MSRLADLIVKGPWVVRDVEPWHVTFDGESSYDTFLAQAVSFRGAIEPIAIVPTLAKSLNDPAAAELMDAKLKILMGAPAMAAALRHSITAMRKMREDADTPEGMEIAEIAIRKMEDALRSAGLSVPLT